METPQPQTQADFLRETLARTEKYNSADLEDYQRAQLAHLLRHAREQSPFYRERLAPLFRKDGRINWRAWKQIPILSRAELQKHGREMMSETLPGGHGAVHESASSGTTGMPVTVYSSTLMGIAGGAAFGRACRWYGQNDDDRLCVSMGDAELEALNPKSWVIGRKGSDRLDDPAACKRLAVSWSWPGEHILALMAQHQSTCFSGHATNVEDIAEAQTRQRRNVRMKFMVGVAMAVTDRARGLAGIAFNAPVYSAYSSEEVHKIAHQCPVSGGFHVNSELVRVEILDDNNEPCWPGESGRVVVTPVLSAAQPLIRYEQGDMATWGEPCACGRAHPVLARIDGRMRHRFQFGNGRRFNPVIGFAHYRDLLKADRWQVAQTGPFAIEVRYVSSAPDGSIEFEALTQKYRQNFHPDIKVTYRRLETMPRTAAGKFIDYVNEYQS